MEEKFGTLHSEIVSQPTCSRICTVRIAQTKHEFP
jgi:hypothetical protein